MRTRAQQARAAIAEDFDEEDSAQTTRHPRIEEVQDEEDTQPVVVREKTPITDPAPVIQSNSAPEHLYQNVKDTALLHLEVASTVQCTTPKIKDEKDATKGACAATW